MKEEEEWCLSWLNTQDVKQALNVEFLEEVLTQKYANLNQQATEKGKSMVDEAIEATSVAANEEVYEQDLEEATRRSLIENHPVEGQSSKTPTTTIEEDDFGSTPEMPTTPFDLTADVLRKMEEENVLTVLSQHLEGSELPTLREEEPEWEVVDEP